MSSFGILPHPSAGLWRPVISTFEVICVVVCTTPAHALCRSAAFELGLGVLADLDMDMDCSSSCSQLYTVVQLSQL